MDSEFEVLSLLTEDLYGLWELEGWVPIGREALRPVLEDLVRRGLAEWFTKAGANAKEERWQGPDGPDLSDPAIWEVPEGDDAPQVLITATQAGEEDYFGRPPITP